MSDPRHDDREVNADDVSALSFFKTSVYNPWSSVPHYYGDFVRQLLLGAAALMIIASPLYTNTLRIQFPFIVTGALLSVAVAALMNPRDRWILVASATLSGIGLVTYAMWGMFGYDTITPAAFVLRMAVAVVFLFAFYFSMKTFRAFVTQQIGRRETIDEFEDENEKREREMLEREQSLQAGEESNR